MAFQFYLDGQLTNQPDNDTDLITTIKRNSDQGGFLITQDVTLKYSATNATLTGMISGYAYLLSRFESGTCNEVDIEVYDQVSTNQTNRIYTGVISINSIQINEQEVSMTMKIDDNSYYSFIKNNRNIKFNTYATRTKNQEIIVPPQIYEVNMFWSATGAYGSSIGILYRGYRIYDLLAFLVPAISDNRVTFESDYLQEDIQLFLFDGSALANHDTDPNIIVSFDQIMKELFKLKNISFYINQTDPDNPILRVEPTDWFYQDSTIYTVIEPQKVITSIKTDNVYGTISVGSTNNIGGPNNAIYTFNAGTSYFGWKEEQYTPYGQCNTDAELDLVNDFSISSNAINYQVGGAVTTDLDKLFIVECDNVDTTAFTATAVDWEIFGVATKWFYNIGLNNINKVNLHSTSFQSALTNTQAAGTDICHITLGQDYVVFDLNPGGSGNPSLYANIPFADEFGGDNYDAGNNWSLVNYDYTVTNPGNYSFKTSMELTVANCASMVMGIFNPLFNPNVITTDVKWGVTTSVGISAFTDGTYTTMIGQASKTYSVYIDADYLVEVALPINLPTGAKVRVSVLSQAARFAPNPTGTYNLGQSTIALPFGDTPLDNSLWTFSAPSGSPTPYGSSPNRIIIANDDSTFECNGTPDGQMIIAQPDLSVYKSRLHEFDWHLSESEFLQIIANPIASFTFIKDGVSRTGWIEDLQHNNWTGQTKIKLISNATI